MFAGGDGPRVRGRSREGSGGSGIFGSGAMRGFSAARQQGTAAATTATATATATNNYTTTTTTTGERKRGGLTWTERLNLAIGAARGVAYIHSRGIRHADVKPDNFLVNQRAQVKLADFGEAVSYVQAKRRSRDGGADGGGSSDQWMLDDHDGAGGAGGATSSSRGARGARGAGGGSGGGGGRTPAGGAPKPPPGGGKKGPLNESIWAGLGSGSVSRAGGGAGTVAFTAPELLVRMYRLFLPPEALAAAEAFTEDNASMAGGGGGGGGGGGDSFSANTDKADVYSLGVTLWVISTGRDPFAHLGRDVDLFELGRRVLVDHERPAVPHTCPLPFYNLLSKCWAADPATRPSAQDVVDRLEEMLRRHSRAVGHLPAE